MTTRGIRNFNPGNIERTATRWQGMADDQSRDERFIQFDHVKWGIRAIARILITYQDQRLAKNGTPIDSIQEIIDRWAPPHENPTDAYAEHIAIAMSTGVNDFIDICDYDTMFHIVKSIIHFENGMQPYSDDTINQGLRLAGIDVPVKSLSKSRTIKAASTASATTSLTILLEGFSDIIEPLVPYTDVAQYVLLTITMIGIGITVWARIDDANKENR